ncbi:MAG TPA: tRNA (adenosine(37)-N6)-dimethylallyltransferase MiaA [Roseiarcus sp.]|nr:tRNA (adenosine(37)-N6)-dimethylallyltransferase MiaA [Roseiarcus sp.]
MRRVLLIAGPTASGKSAAALELACAFGAVIVNADSMQVYSDLRILTARPTSDEEAKAPHRLFGEIDGAVNYSVGSWLRRARGIMGEIGEKPVVFVGGTGLYFRALTEGLSDMPAIPGPVRERIRAEAEGRASADLHAELAALDPSTAARLRPSDRQRTLRALEVYAATGRPLVAFQAARAVPALRPGEWTGLFLEPDRGALYSRIDARFDAMLDRGALDETAALIGRGLDPALPVMRALGVRQLVAHFEGRLSLAEAAESAKAETRRYAKRQFTWGRHQLLGFKWVGPEEALDEGKKALRKSFA